MNQNNIIFVCGCPRSATSAFSWALAEHKLLKTSSESNFLYYLLRNLESEIYKSFEIAEKVEDGWFNKHQISKEKYLQFIGKGLLEMFTTTCETDIFIEQSPENILVVDKLLIMFPNAKILHMVRDGREVVSSMLKSGFKSPWSKDFEKACETWNHYAKKGFEFSTKYPQNVLNVYQKDLVHDTENAVKKVFDFLELDFEENTLHYLKTKRVNSSYGNDENNNFKTAKDTALLKTPQWEKWTKKEKDLFNKIAGDTMKILGIYK